MATKDKKKIDENKEYDPFEQATGEVQDESYSPEPPKPSPIQAVPTEPDDLPSSGGGAGIGGPAERDRDMTFEQKMDLATNKEIQEQPKSEGDVTEKVSTLRQAVNTTPADDKETRKQKEDINAALDRIYNEYKAERDRLGWAEAFEKIGHGLTQLAAAHYGMKHGVDMSGLKFDKTDWDRKREGLMNEMKQRQAERLRRRELDITEGKEIARQAEAKRKAEREAEKETAKAAEKEEKARLVSEKEKRAARSKYINSMSSINLRDDDDEEKAASGALITRQYFKDIGYSDAQVDQMLKDPTTWESVKSWVTGTPPEPTELKSFEDQLAASEAELRKLDTGEPTEQPEMVTLKSKQSGRTVTITKQEAIRRGLIKQ